MGQGLAALAAFALAAAGRPALAGESDRAGAAGTGGASPAAPPAGATLEGSAELSTYADTDNVTVITPTARAGMRDDPEGWRLGARYLVDVVSAASVDIVSTASSRWREVRHVAGVDGEYGPGDLRGAASASVSVEPDYLSLSGGLSPSWKIDDDHVTLAVAYALGHDTIGRADTPFSVFHRTLVRHQMAAGASFVLSPSSILWLGGDAVLERGDQSKPYRYVPMFDAATTERVPRGAHVALVNALRRDERPLEQLPTARDRYAVTGRWLHRSSWATLRLEERLYTDTWGQLATTTEGRYAMDLSERLTLAPDVRLHVQSAAGFWRRVPTVSETAAGVVIPTLRTGDRELGPLATVTVGADVRLALGPRVAATRMALVFRLAGIHTSFLDALFITSRSAVFSAVGFEGAFQ
ncbi:MAG: DUF3570 domain-containing protein [Labilithrix sp.]|nr:DUF3570 domain-containing protein [Labilithrix sp.]